MHRQKPLTTTSLSTRVSEGEGAWHVEGNSHPHTYSHILMIRMKLLSSSHTLVRLFPVFCCLPSYPSFPLGRKRERERWESSMPDGVYTPYLTLSLSLCLLSIARFLFSSLLLSFFACFPHLLELLLPSSSSSCFVPRFPNIIIFSHLSCCWGEGRVALIPTAFISLYSRVNIFLLDSLIVRAYSPCLSLIAVHFLCIGL